MAEHSLFSHYRREVDRYLRSRDWDETPVMAGDPFVVEPLAGGEYNLNYLVRRAGQALVCRVNIGTQIGRDDQIIYEYEALRLLSGSGVTPKPWFVDNSRTDIDRGILIMDYLPGRMLDYRRDLAGAARTLAAVHRVRPATHQLIVEDRPLSLIYAECVSLLQRYFQSPLGAMVLKRLLEHIVTRLQELLAQERYFCDHPWPCIVNTEVNSGNFIVNDHHATVHLVDWEMPRWGDPSTDLCHFYSPLTTLWKSDYRFNDADRAFFLQCYLQAVDAPGLAETLMERLRIKYPFVLLRGISWSAMGWVAYQTDYAGIRNEDTWRTLQRYLDVDFIDGLFRPVLP